MGHTKVFQIGAAIDDATLVEDLRSIGPKSKKQLNAIGIFTAGDLKREGVLDTYYTLLSVGVKPNLNYVWAMMSALLDVEFSRVPQDLKDAIRKEMGHD